MNKLAYSTLFFILALCFFIPACNTGSGNENEERKHQADPIKAVKDFVNNGFNTQTFLTSVCNYYLSHTLDKKGLRGSVIQAKIDECVRMAASEDRNKRLFEAIELVYNEREEAAKEKFSEHMITALKLPVEGEVDLYSKLGQTPYGKIMDFVEPYLGSGKNMDEKFQYSTSAVILAFDLYKALFKQSK